MSLLTIHSEYTPEFAEVIHDFDTIVETLKSIEVKFERWQTEREFGPDADQDKVLSAFAKPVETLKALYGFKTADVISVTHEHPQKQELRAQFLDEHTHGDFEVRLFVEGRGLFFLHPDENIYAVLCEQRDLISLPANTRHWFDMGANPNFKCIRLFTTPKGLVANYTGSKIANKFPRLEQFLKDYA